MKMRNILLSLLAVSPVVAHGKVLIHETFDDANLSGRGWYDNTNQVISRSEHVANSKGSLQYTFKAGATSPTSGGAIRRLFTESDSVYLSYHIKYSKNWVGSGQPHHPHQFHFMTNKDGRYSGIAETYLTTYIEDNGGRLQFVIQDTENIDQSKIGQDLSNVSESRAVAGCNGNTDGYSADCYKFGPRYRNSKSWKSESINFTNQPGPNYKADWHHVEAYMKLNSIKNGKGATDGVIKIWVDGKLIMNHTDIILRTARNSDMRFNQLAIGPYIGNGSPVEQSFWIDDLVVATERPKGSVALPSPPQNLQTTSR